MVDWSVEQPIFVYVQQLTWKHFPEVAMSYSERKNYPGIHPSKGVGGFGHTVTAHGGPSRHAEGRACDIYFYTWEPELYALGKALFDQLAAHATLLGIEDLIYYKWTWSARHPTVHPSDATDTRNHRDHLHVGFSRAASQNTPSILESLFAQARHDGMGPLHNSMAPPPAGIRGVD